LPGNGFGQYGSGWNFGTPGALEGCPIGGGGGSAKAGLARLAMTAASRSTLNDPIMTIPPRQNGLFLVADRVRKKVYAFSSGPQSAKGRYSRTMQEAFFAPRRS
jgi:hypothetical protein